MSRSLIDRSKAVENLQAGYYLSCPRLVQSDVAFEHSKQASDGVYDLGNDQVDGDNLKATHTCNFRISTVEFHLS